MNRIGVSLESSISSVSKTEGAASFKIRPFRALRKHALLASSCFIVVAALGAVALRSYLKPTYLVQSTIYVSPVFPKELADDHEHDRQYDAFIEQQINAIPEYEIIQGALQSLPNVWRLAGESEQNAVARLQKSLKVAELGRSYLISVSLQSNNPSHLADLVNAVTTKYLLKAHGEEFFGRDERLATLAKEKTDLTTQLDKLLAEQDTVLKAVGMAHFSSVRDANPFDVELSKLREELADAHQKRTVADARFASLYATGANTKLSTLDEAAASEVDTDPSLSSLKIQLATRRAVLLSQMNGLTAANPLRVQASAEMLELDKQLDAIAAGSREKKALEIQQRYVGERDRAQAVENQLQRDISKTTGDVVAAVPKLQRAEILNSEIDRIQGAYAAVETRIQSLSLEGSSPGSIHLDHPAIEPTEPVARSRALFYGLLLGFSGLIAMAAAVIAEKLDPVLYTAADVQGIIGFPPLGTLLEEEDFGGRMEEEYFLRLSGGIEQALRRTGARTLMFTSVGTGNSVEIVRRLGKELSKSGLRTLVVLPGAEHEEQYGLSQPVEESPEKSLSISGLRTNPAGDALEPQLVTEPNVVVLNKHSIQRFLRETRSAYDSILVAADPLLASAWSENLSRVADGTILIAQSNRTTKEQMARAASIVERLKVPGIAVVLSEVRRSTADETMRSSLLDYQADTQVPA